LLLKDFDPYRQANGLRGAGLNLSSIHRPTIRFAKNLRLRSTHGSIIARVDVPLRLVLRFSRRRLMVELLGVGHISLFQLRKEIAMFTRIVECYVKREKRQEFAEKMQNLVLPILQSQPGFVDVLALSSEDEPERTVSISLWRSRADADLYHREHFNEIVDTIRPLLRDEPSVEFYNVEASTAHRIAAGKAA
jgi:quinol monooxygenase YgiN